MNNIIEIKKLEKKYNNKKIHVLNKINFSFKKGKIYSLVGPSGSGKSTLLNLLSLIDSASSGSIRIGEYNINYNNRIENDKIRASKIGIIYQDKNLLSDFTVLENIYLARLALNENKKNAIKDSIKIIKKFGLVNRQNHLPSELSGGEIQRVAIARAIINSPQIILADEPTGNLDLKNAKIIFKTLLNLREKNRLIIYATHNRYFANMADCKIQLISGKIRAVTNGRIK
jgi:ABC-type lipoprotein export system ATPase subunit|tara:strand:- start:3364 stop:4050 length:687 start_codon:yes stop_codon:yes gene_type:complete